MPKLSIIIPTKNEEKHLPTLLEDIHSQVHKDFEIIVADAFSTDKTRAIAESFGARVIDGGMPGPGRNRGAAVANGEFFLFFDADVQLPSHRFVSDCLREFEERSLDLAGCKVNPLSHKPLDQAFHQIYNTYALATERVQPHLSGCNIFVKKSVHESLHGFDEEIVFAEDMDYARRAVAAGYNFRILRSHPVATSVRRLEKDGRLGSALKFFYGEVHLITKGAMKEIPFDYHMGGGEKNPMDLPEQKEKS